MDLESSTAREIDRRGNWMVIHASCLNGTRVGMLWFAKSMHDDVGELGQAELERDWDGIAKPLTQYPDLKRDSDRSVGRL